MPIPTEPEITSRVTYHPPTEEAKRRHEDVRRAVRHAMIAFASSLPDTRETSLAFTKLEEAMFWANAAIARNHDKLTGAGLQGVER